MSPNSAIVPLVSMHAVSPESQQILWRREPFSVPLAGCAAWLALADCRHLPIVPDLSISLLKTRTGVCTWIQVAREEIIENLSGEIHLRSLGSPKKLAS